METEGRFYVYIHKRRSDRKVFYVGKGCNRRSGSRHGRNRHWKSVVAKHGFTHHIVARFADEMAAYSFEASLIKLYGIENLTNAIDSVALVYSEEERKVRSEKCANRSWSDEVKEKQSLSKRGSLNHNYGKPILPHVMDAMLAKVKKPVVNRNTGDKFDSAESAAAWVRLNMGKPKASRTMIIASCKGHRELSYGQNWEYANG